MKNIKIGFIGAGNMATAMIEGILRAKSFLPANLFVCDLDNEKLKTFSDKGITTVSNSVEVAKQANVIVLAVKPQNYAEVLSEIKDYVTENDVFVTIAAGISTEFIVKALGKNCPVVRAMPNTPLLLSCGATAISKTDNLSDEKFEIVKTIFSNSGIIEILDESQMNSVISINGSSPAYIYLFAKAVADYASESGIDYNKALNLFCKTLEGSAKMLINSGNTPDELIKKVCSSGGTTIAAMNKLNDLNFYNIIKEAMDACTKRAGELEK